MTPPRLATWLLRVCGSGPDLDTIAGDLSEQYPCRSRGWYWRQVGYAIVLSALAQLRTQWVRAVVAVWAGGLVMGAGQLAMRQIAFVVLPPLMGPQIGPASWPVLLLTVTVPAFFTGWLLARLNRPHGAPFVLAFALGSVSVALLPRLLFLVRNSFEHERFVPYLVTHLFGVMPSYAAALMIGAFLGRLVERRQGLALSR